MDAQTTIFVVEDDEPSRRALREALESVGFVVEEFASAAEFLTQVDLGRSGCLIWDVIVPDDNGLKLPEILAERGSMLPLIVLTDAGVAPPIFSSETADFLEKPCQPRELIAVVRGALKRAEVCRRHADAKERLARLDECEHQVLEMLLAGLPNKAIAVRAGVSIRTIESRRAKILIKTGAASLLEVAQLAIFCQFAPSGLRHDMAPNSRHPHAPRMHSQVHE